MKFLLKASMPAQGGNRAILNGTLSSTMKALLEEIKPEAAYFTAEGGKRTALLIVNLNDPSEIPGLAEPFFLAFDAEIDLTPVMTPQDLGNAGPAIERAVKKYGHK